jgi:hypothetical protein
MNDLYKALGDISSIRKQVANATEFRGYGPATLACTGCLAGAAALAQHFIVAVPEIHPINYLAIWAATAAISAGITGWQMYTRSRRMHSQLSDEMIRMAAEQFLPALLAGLLLTLVVVLYVPLAFWMLPGLWQIIFSLGVFSSCRFLPKPMAAAAAWYLLTGLSCFALGDARALSPWMMGVPFTAGQFLIASILLLRNTDSADEI